MRPKRLCRFIKNLQIEFPFIKKLQDESSEDFHVQCTICQGTFTVKLGGRKKTKGHQLAVRSSRQSGKFSNYFFALVPIKTFFLPLFCNVQ